MKVRAIIFLVLVFVNYDAMPAERLDLGVFAGTSYYMGNINSSRHFYNLSAAAGGIIRYNFNEHYSLRANLNYGQIKADDLDFGNILPRTRKASFVNNFYDFSLQGEFSFKPFKVTIFRNPVSTYITGGMAYTSVKGSGNTGTHYVNMPFGAGIKYGISKKVTLAMEWILKKSFTDEIDGVKNFGQFNSPSLVHNNDWVSLAGFSITIKPFGRKGDCPVYEN